MTKSSVLILGARSDIGKAVAHRFASLGHPVQLAAREAETLEADKTDMELRYGVSVTLHDFDALAIETHDAFVNDLPQLPQIAVCAVGLMGQQSENERDSLAACREMRSNYEGPASILAVLATQMTEGMDLPEKLTAEPGEVAAAIAHAVERKKDVIYVRPIWRVIMLVIRNIPERVFKGMKV